MKRKIPILVSQKHGTHAPTVEFVNGRLLPYPDVPERIDSLHRHLAKLDICTFLEPTEPVSKVILEETHDKGMLDYLEQMSRDVNRILFGIDSGVYTNIVEKQDYFFPYVFPSRPMMQRMSNSALGHFGFYCFDTESPIGNGTWAAAIYSATLSEMGASLLVSQDADSAYALCRPPGHHSGRDFFGGYCYLNNAAIAAKKLMKMGKVAIIDIDYHHGNGSQSIFWNEPKVFYGSIHGDPDVEYPYYSGYADEQGGENARGTNLNVPLPKGTEGNDFLFALDQVMQRVAGFDPSSIVVSVGFDTYAGDPTGFFQLNSSDYERIGKLIAQPKLPTLFVQEGGYVLDVQGALAEELLRGFLGV